MGASTEDLVGLSANAADPNAKSTKVERSKARSWMSSHTRPQHRVRVASFALAKQVGGRDCTELRFEALKHLLDRTQADYTS